MKKAAILTVSVLFSIAVPALGQGNASATAADAQTLQSDVNAVRKDNTAIQHDDNKIDANRAAKAADKANGSYGKQAVDSVKIGANQTAKAEKQAEKSVDQHIMTHDAEQ